MWASQVIIIWIERWHPHQGMDVLSDTNFGAKVVHDKRRNEIAEEQTEA